VSEEARLAKLEAIVEGHERQLQELRGHVARVNEELAEVKAGLAALREALGGVKEEIDRANSRRMWLVGLTVGALAALAQAIITLLAG